MEHKDPLDNNIPFDMSLACDNQNINNAVNHLLELPRFKIGRKGAVYLKVVIANIVLACKRGNEYKVSYHRGNDYYSKIRHNKRENPYGLGRSLVRYIDALGSLGLIEQIKGFNDPEGKKSILSRIIPSQNFVDEVLIPFKLFDVIFQTRKKHRPVEVRDCEGKIINTYNNLPDFAAMGEKVRAYNSIYEVTDIAYIRPEYGLIHPEGKTLHRVFKNDLTHLGRFYGAWWQSKSGEERSNILINGEETVELDYVGNHIGLLYGMAGKVMSPELRQDPYMVSHPHLRKDIKLCVLMAINNAKSKSAWLSVNRQMFLKDGQNNALPFDTFEAFMKCFFDHHKAIEHLFFNPDLSLKLQYLDSVVTDRVLEEMIVIRGIPTLPIHDSFIVAQRHKDELVAAMRSAYINAENKIISKGFTSIKNKKEKEVYLFD